MGRTQGVSLVERAKKEVPGFAELLHKVERRMTLAGNSPKTLVCYGRSLAQMALHFGLSPVEVDEEEVQEYLYLLAKQKDFSESYFKFSVYALRYAYRTMGLDSKRLDLPEMKKRQTLPVVLSRQECRRLFKAPTLLKHRIVLSLIYSAGLRLNEVRNLLLTDIDSDRMQIRIRQGKGNKDRYVTLSPLMLRGLRDYFLACRPVKYLFNGPTAGEPFAERGLQWLLKEAVRKAGIKKDVTLHTLRHTYATHLLEDGVDIVTIKDQLGHTRIETTMLYLHIAQVRRSLPHSPLDTLYGKKKG
jgi:integrase/recombinase XerD